MQHFSSRQIGPSKAALALRFERPVWDELFDGRARRAGRLIPIGAVDHGRVGLEQAVGFQPVPAAVGRHGHVFQLRARQSGLNLDVGLPWHGEKFLPLATALAHAPHKQFAPLEPRRGELEQPLPAAVQCSNPGQALIWNVIKEIYGVVNVGGV